MNICWTTRKGGEKDDEKMVKRKRCLQPVHAGEMMVCNLTSSRCPFSSKKKKKSSLTRHEDCYYERHRREGNESQREGSSLFAAFDAD